MLLRLRVLFAPAPILWSYCMCRVCPTNLNLGWRWNVPTTKHLRDANFSICSVGGRTFGLRTRSLKYQRSNLLHFLNTSSKIFCKPNDRHEYLDEPIGTARVCTPLHECTLSFRRNGKRNGDLQTTHIQSPR